MAHYFKIIVLLVLGSLVLGCDPSVSEEKKLEDFIPNNATTIYKIPATQGSVSGLEGFISEINSNSLFSSMKNSGLKNLLSENNFIAQLKPTSQVLLCISGDSLSSHFTLITKQNPDLFVLDSLKNKSIETLSYDGKNLQKIKVGASVVFTATQDSVFLVTNSQKLLEQILDGNSLDNPYFKKLYGISNAEQLTIFKKSISAEKNADFSNDLKSWSALNTTISLNKVQGTGIALASDSVELLAAFKGQLPQQFELPKVIPADAETATIFSFSDAELLQNKLRIFRKDTVKFTPKAVFGSLNEIGQIQLKNTTAITTHSLDATFTQDGFAPFVSELRLFRDVQIYSLNSPKLFNEAFAPLISETEMKVMFQMANFFIFMQDETSAEDYISTIISENVLFKTAYFSEASKEISSSGSLLFITQNDGVGAVVIEGIGFVSAEKTSGKISKYPLAMVQYSYDRDFAHIHFICKEVGANSEESGGVSKAKSIKTENAILGNPLILNNARNQNDVVLQDSQNNLLLYNSNGKKQWERKLDSPILGTIEIVDIARNGNGNLAFSTKNKFYVIDGNGKDVSPFPLSFKDEITQPLAVFDYDNDRKYRFIIAQGKQVLMYDSKGKIVNGFNFKKTKTPIVATPQHLRLANKDYLLFAEQNGKLNILSRTGNSRVDVKETFDFNGSEIQKSGNNFMFLTKGKEQVTISESGKVSKKKLEVNGDFSLKTVENTTVTLNDNLLKIDNNLIELPFGVYTQPLIHSSDTKTYITTTETQEHKVYIYNTNGKLLDEFPVYGSSSGFMGRDGSKKLQFITKGADNEVLVYDIE